MENLAIGLSQSINIKALPLLKFQWKMELLFALEVS